MFGLSGFGSKGIPGSPSRNPSVRKIENLINSLLSLGSPFQCRHENSEGQDVLGFYRASEE